MSSRNNSSNSSGSKRNLPEYVHPLGVRFQVGIIPEGETDDHGDLLQGDTNVDTKRIRVTAEKDSGRKWSTLYHEYMHAAFGLIGIDDALLLMGEGFEEMIVRTVETATEQFMLAHGSQYLSAIASQKGEDE